MISDIARRLRTYASFVKLEHTIFSLPLIFAGALLGGRGWPSWRIGALMVLATVGGRTAAMGLNRSLDVDIDRRNPRTAQRELARGAMTSLEGWLVVAAGLIVYFASAAAISPLCFKLSPIPAILFAAYPFLKRFTSLAHFGLGLAWSMAPLGGWLATAQSTARLHEVGWLWVFSWLWVAGFDIIYATLDVASDRRWRVHSLPVAVGARAALRTARLTHIAAWAALVGLYASQLRGLAPLVALTGIGLALIWEHQLAPRRPDVAFFKPNAWIGFLVLLFIQAGLTT